MKLGLALPYTDHLPRELLLAFVKEADRLGYDTAWVPEAYGWDAFTVLTEMACVTERIQLATGIVNVFSRSPALLTQSAASLDAISGGRLKLGLGTSGHQVVEGFHGVPFRRGIRRLRETVDIVRMGLRRERLTYEGEIFHLDGGLRLVTHPVRERVPIYLATLTPAGMELAGEIADGWLPIFFSPRDFERVQAPALARGAARAGRSLDDLSICVYQHVIVTGDVAAGRDAVRPHLALYVGGMGSVEKNYYNRLFVDYGFEAEAARVQELYLARRRDEAIAAVTDEMVDLVTIIGPVEACRRRIRELEQAGAREVGMSLQVPGNDPAEVLAALQGLAPQEVPAS